jgi:hypothetical protein
MSLFTCWVNLCFIFSSPEVSFSDCPLCVIRLSVNFYIFDFLSRTTGPISTRLGINHLWREGDSNLFKWEAKPWGDSSKTVKIHLKFLKIFCRTSRSISIKLGTNHPWLKGIQNCSNKGPEEALKKNSSDLPESFLTQQIYLKASWHGRFTWKLPDTAESSLWKVWFQEVGRGHNRGKYFSMCILERIF